MGETTGHYFFSQLLDVLEYMHRKNVVHRDIKPENILVTDHLQLKLADFGFTNFGNIHKLRSYCGTRTYMAPEIKNGQVYDGRKTDIFSIGVILFIIV